VTAASDAATVRGVDELVELETAVLVAQWRLAIAETERLGERIDEQLRAEVTVGYGSGD
jgi:hypothetical protein